MQVPISSRTRSPSCISSIAMAVLMISGAQLFGLLSATQETFIVASHQYESMRNHYDHHEPNHQCHCIVALPEIVAQHPYGPPARAAVCITQQDVELALDAAINTRAIAAASIGQWPTKTYVQTSETPKALEIIADAELVAQASRILAQKFHLSESEILFELPKIYAGNSPALRGICPKFLKENAECFSDDQPFDGNKFRSLSGFCNNAHEKSWGSARSAMVRFLAPDYQDAVMAPRVATDGSPLPSARVVSFVLHQDTSECDNRNSMLGVVWGQFINHDINLGVRVTDEDERLRDMDCCKQAHQAPIEADYKEYRKTYDCFPIEIPEGDPFYGYFGQKCMNFVRLSPALQPGCSMGPVQAMNKHSSYLDGSSIYGSNAATLKRLRTYQGGLLRSQPVPTTAPSTTKATLAPVADLQAHASESKVMATVADEFGDDANTSGNDQTVRSYMMLGTAPQRPANSLTLTSEPLFKDLLPANVIAPDVGCERRNRPSDLYCFDAGDNRANEQIQLASLHTIMMREHNRLARGLASVNPHWQDERLFQEARKIVGAQIQHITYAEFLPLVVGKEKVREFGLKLAPPGQFFHGYDAKINAGVRVEFQAAAFRYGHSLVPGHIDRFNKFHQKIESVQLSKLLKQPFDLYFPGVLDTYILGLVDQRSGRMDAAMTTEVANHLFEKPGNFFGLDLAAINIQRGREMGVRGYNSYREFCGLPRAKDFVDLTASFSNKTLFRMTQLYKHVDDIDLFTGGISEFPMAGALIGPTFGCLVAKQAALLRTGDRFWYENPGQFSLEQLYEIRRQTSARLLCENADDIENIQANAMLMPEPYTNPRVLCSTLPSIDLIKWKESAAARQQNLYSTTTTATESAVGYGGPSSTRNSEARFGAVVEANRRPAFQVPLAVPHQGHLTLLVHALQQYQKSQQEHEQQHMGVALKTFSHYVDHLVDVTNYRNQQTH